LNEDRTTKLYTYLLSLLVREGYFGLCSDKEGAPVEYSVELIVHDYFPIGRRPVLISPAVLHLPLNQGKSAYPSLGV